MTTAWSTAGVVLAHQGWDELVLFGTPVVLAVLAVRWADRRAAARRAAEDAGDTPEDDSTSTPDAG